MIRDKRELAKLKQRQSLSFSYEGKIKEIDHLKSILSKVITNSNCVYNVLYFFS